ncbi:DNA repair exonuclease, SbcD (plasmid) [Halapricum desulfuricans]|uniref:DNA repair exonuclease, SbcD n=2 Tax=Halapricum desulfuricans TaxID=2841257 RepID=A0A897NP82_9EURY|nr:DNA repair exonuclease, SbcD [Halapricum desulfuricans]
MNDALSLLYTGDLHLGRHPSRIPDDLDGPGLSPKAVWLSAVREAIEQDVDAVVVAGDIVDQENRYFEAYGTFEDGIAQLDDAGIPVVVVAGNHDYEALPEMVDNLDSDTLQFLGRGGEWERWTLEEDGEPVVHFDGWSFAAEHVYESPLAEYELSGTDDVPQIGVLHADLDSRGSRYAPVLSSDLRDTAVDAWLLGHIHSPGIRIDSRPLALYSGSPQPLDPGEQQAHGPWMITILETGEVRAEQIPLASVRYDQVSVDVSGVDDPQEATAVISAELKDHVRADLDASSLELSLVRVHLTGRTAAHSALVDQHRSMERDLGFREGSVSVRIESIDVDTRPEIDLEALAEGENAAAYLANLLLEIENGDPRDTYGEVVEDSLMAVRQAHSANAYNPLRRETELEEPGDADAIEHLEQQARVLLDTLLSQKEGNA